MSKISGLKFNQRTQDAIDQSNVWLEKRISEGWMKTEMGWLSPQDIEASGMQYKTGFKIPTEEYISEHSDGLHKKGEKYIAASRKFLTWRQRYIEKNLGIVPDSYIEEQIEKEESLSGEELLKEFGL